MAQEQSRKRKSTGVNESKRSCIREFCISVGQCESLTTRLRSILGQYESSIDVFKEMVQNADDAKASTVKILFDHSTYPSESLLDPSMEAWQGPAIYFYNDSRFTQEDFENIMKIFGETKRNSLDKIGKFGLGFNTVYHLTDLPSFVSGRCIHMLDPHMKYIPDYFSEPGFSVDFITYNAEVQQYKDQFRVFNVFKCDVFSEKEFEGTLFRLPFRSNSIKSEISENEFGQKKIQELLSHIVDESEAMIRFLQHVECIEVFQRQNGASNEDQLVRVTKKVNSNPLDRPFLSKNSQHFDKIMQGCNTDPIHHTQDITISKKLKKIAKSEEFKISYASGTHQCLDYFKASKDCTNLPFCSILLPISTLSPDKESSQRVFSLYSFLPLPITSPYHKYYVNGCFEIDSSRRGLAATEDGSDKTRWNQSLINDALVNALLYLLVSVTKCFSNRDESHIIRYYDLWPNDRFEHSVLWREFPREFAIRAMETNLPVFCYEFGGEIEWRGYHDVSFIRVEEYYSHERIGQFWDLIKGIALFSNIRLVKIPVKFNNSHVFQVIYENRADKVYTLQSACETILHSKIRDLKLQQLKLILHTLLPLVNLKQGGWCKEFLSNSECIPCGTQCDYSLIFPSRVVCTHSLAAKLYSPADKRTIHPEFSELMVEKSVLYKALKELNMINGLLPCEDLIERCQCQVNYSSAKRQLIEYLNYMVKQSKNGYSDTELPRIKSVLLNVEFLPVWENELLIKLGVQGIKMFASPGQCSPFSLRQLIPADYYAITEEIDKLIEPDLKIFLNLDQTQYTPDLKLIVSLLKSLQEKETRIIELNLQKLVTQFCEKIFCVLFECWRISKTDGTVFGNLSLNHRLCVWHPTHQMFTNLSNIVSTKKYEFCGSKYLLSFPYKLSSDPELDAEFLRFLEVREDIIAEDACNIIHKIADDFGNNPVHSEEVRLIINLINSFFEQFENLTLGSKTCLLLSTERRLCNPSNLIIDDLYLQGGRPRKLKDNHSIVHGQIHPKCAYNLGAKSIRSKLYTHKPFKVSDFGQHEDITVRIENVKRGYPNGINILKELIQNAEDSGATEMSLLLDHQTYSDKTKTLCFNESEHPHWKDYQKFPSLLVYNNSSFTEEDLEGIQCVGLGGKQNRNTIGKFGLGFNAVYHLTKSPCFITRNPDTGITTLCAMDPYREFLRLGPNELPGIRLDLKDIELSEFSDQFEPYSLFSKINGHFPTLTRGRYSIFRIPLMTSSTTEVNRLLNDLLGYSTKLSLFLDKIHKISVYSHDKTGQVACIGSTNTETCISSSISPPCPYQYVKNINVCFKEISVETEIPSTQPLNTSSGKRTKSDSKTTTRSWLLFNFTGPINGLEGVCYMLRNHRDKIKQEKLTHEVFGGVAVEVPQNETDIKREESSSLFSYLPIGRDSNKSFPVQVNAPFILASDRQYIKFSDTSQKSMQLMNWEDVWHAAILEHVITPLFASLLLTLKDPANYHSFLKRLSTWEKPKYYDWYYTLYPNVTSMLKGNIQFALGKYLYSLLYQNNERILINAMYTEWYPLSGPEGGVFKCDTPIFGAVQTSTLNYTNNQRSKVARLSTSGEDSISDDELFSILSKLKYPLTCAPCYIAKAVDNIRFEGQKANRTHFRTNTFNNFKLEIQRVNQTHFLSFINRHKYNFSKTGGFPTPLSESILTIKDISILFTFLFRATSEEIRCYNEIPLKIDFNGNLNVFNQYRVSFYPTYASLLPDCADLFISSEFPNSLFNNLAHYKYLESLSSNFLSKHLRSDSFSREQISLFWIFILDTKIYSHKMIDLFGKHCLVPVRALTISRKFVKIEDITSLLKCQNSQNCIYALLLKLNCPLLYFEELSSFINEDGISELNELLNPLIISDSISPESFLKAVKLTDYNSLNIVNFEANEACSLRNLLLSCNMSALDLESVRIIGSLKMFISENDALRSITDFKQCLINKHHVPICALLREILEESTLGVFKVDMNQTEINLIESISRKLNVDLINIDSLFSDYIFPNFTRLDLVEQKSLLNFIYNMTDGARDSIVSHLRSLQFIPRPQSLTKYAVSEFYSPTVKLFELFFPHLLLPDHWNGKKEKEGKEGKEGKEDYFDLFCDIGLVYEINLELVVDAALQVENGTFPPESEAVETLISKLVSILSSKKDLNSEEEDCLTKLASIPFLPVWKIIPSESEKKLTFARFNEANLSAYKYSCCTTSYIHHDKVSQLLPKLDKTDSEGKNSKLQLIFCIPTEPIASDVVDHLNNISRFFSEIVKFHNKDSPSLFYSTYKYLQEKKDSVKDLVAKLKETPCLFHEDSLYYPRNMVFNLDSHLMKYLFKVPDALYLYKEFLEMVGVEESPTYSHYASVLADIMNDLELDDVERKNVSRTAFLLFVESLRKIEDSCPISLNRSTTYALTDQLVLVPINQVVYLDNTRLKVHMKYFDDLSQLLFLYQLPPNRLGSSEPPAALKMNCFSNIIHEAVEQSKVKDSPNTNFLHESQKVEGFLKSPEFANGLARIYYHEMKGQGKGNLNSIRINNHIARDIYHDPSIGSDTCFKTVSQALEAITVKMVDHIPISITNRRNKMRVLVNDIYRCFFQDSVLYARGGTLDVHFFHDLTYALNLYLGSIFNNLHLFELCLSSSDCSHIKTILDSYNIPPCPYLDDTPLTTQLSPLPSLPSSTRFNSIPSSSSRSRYRINLSVGMTRSNLIHVMHTANPSDSIGTESEPQGPITRQDELNAKLWIRTAQCDLRAAQKLLYKSHEDTSFPPHACANCFECAMKTCIAILYINKYNEANLFCQRNLDILLDLVNKFFPPEKFEQFSSHCIPLINFNENAKNPCMTPGIGCCIPMDLISLETAENAVKNACKLLELVRTEFDELGKLMFEDAEVVSERPSVSLLKSQLDFCKLRSYKYLVVFPSC